MGPEPEKMEVGPGCTVSAVTMGDLLDLVQKYLQKPGNAAGGSLHLVLDSGNLTEYGINNCLRMARVTADTDAIVIARLLLATTEHKRDQLYWLLQRSRRGSTIR